MLPKSLKLGAAEQETEQLPSPFLIPSFLYSFLRHAAAVRTLPSVLCLAAFLATIPLVPADVGDSLAVGQSIRDNETLISPEGTFRLGFFTGRPNRRYLGMWYNKVPLRTVVWVANRQRPLRDSTGSLVLLRNGSLVLADTAGTVYWSANPSGTLGNPVVRLLDEGNLVVSDEGDSSYAWQSFAEPTDTLLPGMNIGVNRRTGATYNITAWKTLDDPKLGDYSWVLIDRGVPQLFVMNGSAPLWRGGAWVGDRFTGVPEMKANGFFSYGFTSNSDELYFKFDVWNKSMLTRIHVDPSGSAKHLRWVDGSRTWEPLWESANDTCDRLGVCGANALCNAAMSGSVCRCMDGFQTPQQQTAGQRGATGTAAVCERTRTLSCPGGEDTFVLMASAKLPDTSWAMGATMGFDDCRAACLRNCSCTAFTSADGSGCITWFGNLTDLRYYRDQGQDLYVRVASDGGKSGKKVIIIIVVLVVFVIIFLSLLFHLFRRRQMRRKRLQGSQQSMDVWHCEGSENSDFDLALFHFNILEIATNYFSFQNKLGEGGYGPVYKGKLHDGQCVAIKRLSKDSTQGLEQFKSEIKLVARLQHTNLVRLLGCCIENEEKILVYEYMQNQSLDRFIFDANRGRQLDWAKRLHIIEGITQGLLYLHKYSRLRVIHRDLKASNILLDDEWNPKISDFGLARIFSWNEPQANTKRIIGTYGYMPPEYAMRGLFSVKSDVFSFGILLLEILSGKKNTSIHDFGISRNLPGHAWELWREGRELELVDPAMGNSVSKPDFSRCFHVALLCVQENPVDRPTMLDIVSMLNSEATSLPPPNQPAFFLVRPTSEEGDIIEMEHASSSNSVTFTSIQGR